MLANLAVLPVPVAYHTRALESGLFKGIVGHKNMVGNMALLALMLGSVCWRAKAALIEKALWFAFMGGWAVLLYLSGSKTAIALLFLVPIALLSLAAVRGIVPVSPVTLIISGLIVVASILAFVVWGMGYTMEQVMAAIFPDPTLTNRTYLWEYAMSKVNERPMLGWGFQSFWGLGYDSPAARAPVVFARVVNQAHNGYIDLLINLGIVGTAIFAWVMMAYLSGLRKVGRYSSRLRFLMWTLFLIMILNNITESQFLRYNIPQWTMFIVCFFWVTYITLLLKPRYAVPSVKRSYNAPAAAQASGKAE
jgi:O-antigen ligase